jgi:hypothetical protein
MVDNSFPIASKFFQNLLRDLLCRDWPCPQSNRGFPGRQIDAFHLPRLQRLENRSKPPRPGRPKWSKIKNLAARNEPNEAILPKRNRLMDGWDVALGIVAAYLAVTALIRLMLAYRDKVLADFRAEIQRQQAAEKQSADKKPAAGRERAA